MPIKALTLPLVFVLLAGCAGDPTYPVVAAGHPASPDAPSAPPPPLSPTLALSPATAPAVTQPAGPITYACPHHPEVISDKPAQCPKCNMKLVARESTGTGHGEHR